MRASPDAIRSTASQAATQRMAALVFTLINASLLAVCSTPVAAETPPKAKSVPATDTYPGFEVVDPYRNLEQLDDPDTQAWMKAQADHARRVLDGMPGRARIRAALDDADAMLAFSSSDIRPATATRMFYRRREAGEPTQKLYVRDGLRGTPRLVFDPSRLDTPGQTHAISWYVPSPSGRRVAVAAGANGSEMSDFYVLDVDNGEQLDGPLPRSWLGWITWLDEDRMLLGRFNPAAPDAPPTEAWKDSQVFLHRVGNPIEQDLHVFGTRSRHPPEGLPPEHVVAVMRRAGEPFAVAMASGTENHYSAWVLPASQLGDPDAGWRRIFGTGDLNQWGGQPLDGKLHAISTRSPNGEIVEYDLATGARQVLRPAGDRPIESLAVSTDGLYFRERDGVYIDLKRIGFDGRGETTIRFPRSGNPYISPMDPVLAGRFVLLESWTAPSQDFLVQADGSVVPTHLKPTAQGLDLSPLQSRDLVATSHDGTQVPLSLVHFGNLKPPGEQRVLLYGYGAYGISEDPLFNPLRFAAIAQGIAHATCHVRGGGEHGDAWRKAGHLARKPNTWKDFIACAEALVAQGITVPAQLVGMGVSAGGILIGNAVHERPDLFAGAVNDVGVTDVLRMLSASQNGPNHYAEFGDIRTPEGAAAARGMSVYQRIEDGRAYPPGWSSTA
ncbi:prolyl oligopeptidase family serine peptidase [Luteimonas aestuarii]|nr:prolyl oligopeptidase family serine peptidase [Luteimonas aestuarii]